MSTYDPARRLALFPITARLEGADGQARLKIGGCDLEELAGRFGTPLYLYDQATLDAMAGAYREALRSFYPGESGITYAGKAFLCAAMAGWAQQQGLWVDCTAASEIGMAAAAGLERARLLVHGVNKGAVEMRAALAHAGTAAVDNLTELEKWIALGRDGARLPDLWLRIRPGLAVEAHAYNQTGLEDSKFGMSPAEVRQAIRLGREAGLPLSGLHFHLGSRFRDPEPVGQALDAVLELMAALGAEEGWRPAVVCPGGGWGVAYHEEELPHPDIEDYVRFVAERLANGCAKRGLPLPRLQVEPGRSLAARAGVALYRVGTVKQTPRRRWLLLDGGMTDNLRPALYGARYSALPVREPGRPALGPAWLAGPYCESGDVLIEALPLPDLAPGELVAIPVSGAYQLSMANNYNGACRPAVAWLQRDEARLVVRRETTEDLARRDEGSSFLRHDRRG